MGKQIGQSMSSDTRRSMADTRKPRRTLLLTIRVWRFPLSPATAHGLRFHDALRLCI